MQKITTNYDVTTDDIPNEWMERLEKDGLASVARKGPASSLIQNIMNYSKQLVVLGSATKMLVSLN